MEEYLEFGKDIARYAGNIMQKYFNKEYLLYNSS